MIMLLGMLSSVMVMVTMGCMTTQAKQQRYETAWYQWACGLSFLVFQGEGHVGVDVERGEV